MTSWNTIKCPVCGTNIQTAEVLDYCPLASCGAYIADKLYLSGEGTGIDYDPPSPDAT